MGVEVGVLAVAHQLLRGREERNEERSEGGEGGEE